MVAILKLEEKQARGIIDVLDKAAEIAEDNYYTLLDAHSPHKDEYKRQMNELNKTAAAYKQAYMAREVVEEDAD